MYQSFLQRKPLRTIKETRQFFTGSFHFKTNSFLFFFFLLKRNDIYDGIVCERAVSRMTKCSDSTRTLTPALIFLFLPKWELVRGRCWGCRNRTHHGWKSHHRATYYLGCLHGRRCVTSWPVDWPLKRYLHYLPL